MDESSSRQEVIISILLTGESASKEKKRGRTCLDQSYSLGFFGEIISSQEPFGVGWIAIGPRRSWNRDVRVQEIPSDQDWKIVLMHSGINKQNHGKTTWMSDNYDDAPNRFSWINIKPPIREFESHLFRVLSFSYHLMPSYDEVSQCSTGHLPEPW